MKKILYVVILLFVIVISCGCFNTKMVGNYNIIEVIDNDVVISKKELNEKKINYTLKIYSNKKAIITMDGKKEELKYDNKYFYKDGNKIDYIYEDGKITLKEDELKMIFEKRN